MTTDAKRRANRLYDKENTIMVSVKLNKNTDADIIKRINCIDNKQRYLKALMRHDIYFNKKDKNE